MITLTVIGTLIGLFFIFKDQYLYAESKFIEWVQGIGWIGPFVVTGVYIIMAILLLPSSLISIGIGFAFTWWVAAVTVIVASNIGANLVFWISRLFLRQFVENKLLTNYSIFATFDKIIAANGWKIVILVRLSPIFPYTVLNYALGVSKVVWYQFSVATLFGMIPGTIIYIWIGIALRQAGESLNSPIKGTTKLVQTILFWIGLAITIILVIFLTWWAKREIKREIEKSDNAENT